MPNYFTPILESSTIIVSPHRTAISTQQSRSEGSVGILLSHNQANFLFTPSKPRADISEVLTSGGQRLALQISAQAYQLSGL